MATTAVHETTPRISFQVLGVPAPQGSKTAVTIAGKARVIEAGSATGRARHRSWRRAVAEAARDIVDTERLDTPLDGPLWLDIGFRLPMPTSRPKRLRTLGQAWHTTRPDLSKLIRSTEDALTDAGLIRDDARISWLTVTKVEVIGWTGADITIGPARDIP